MNQISSLEEKACAQVAINLCQENGFKEVALCLEKPTYGGFINLYEPSVFVSDPQKLSVWAKVKEDNQLCDIFVRSCYLDDVEKVRQWDTAIDEQYQRLTEGIPLPDWLRQKIHFWINRIALEYLSYSRRQEVLFGVSRYFLMDILTRGDWKEAARLDEKKLAERLLEDERLTVLQRYRIACVYCLHLHIPQLWERLIQEGKQFISSDGKHGLSEETNSLVLLWSCYMNTNQKEKVASLKNFLWTALSQAISYGNRVALMVCWKEFRKVMQQKTVINRALESLRQWQMRKKGSCVKIMLVSNQSPSAGNIKDFNLPSYYSELMVFFLSQMDQEQQLTFFRKAFLSEYGESVLECFLDWPHQDNFLPTISRLWGIIPKDEYERCLSVLASKYSENDTNASCDYDYRGLLQALWEETPEEYKQYVFCDFLLGHLVINPGKDLLSQLLERSPFQEKDEALFKQIFRDQPQGKRREMMLSAEGEKMCSLLLQKGKWSFLNWLLEECLSKQEIPDFKKRFIQSTYSVKLCLDILEENRENQLLDLLDWSTESDAEKTQCKDELKCALINGDVCLDVCASHLRVGKFADVERMINFCLSSDERKERFKVRFAQHACGVLLEHYAHDSRSGDCVWEQMDAIIGWSVKSVEKIRYFKEDLFFRKRIDIHYKLVFIEALWGKVERFYQWFGLSLKEIIHLKIDTLFTPWVIEHINRAVHERTYRLVAPLHWCFTDEEIVIDLKEEVEEYFRVVLDDREIRETDRLGHLVSELLDGFRKEELLDKTSRDSINAKDAGRKRSVGIVEDESSSPRKRCK